MNTVPYFNDNFIHVILNLHLPDNQVFSSSIQCRYITFLIHKPNYLLLVWPWYFTINSGLFWKVKIKGKCYFKSPPPHLFKYIACFCFKRYVHTCRAMVHISSGINNHLIFIFYHGHCTCNAIIYIYISYLCVFPCWFYLRQIFTKNLPSALGADIHSFYMVLLSCWLLLKWHILLVALGLQHGFLFTRVISLCSSDAKQGSHLSILGCSFKSFNKIDIFSSTVRQESKLLKKKSVLFSEFKLSK